MQRTNVWLAITSLKEESSNFIMNFSDWNCLYWCWEWTAELLSIVSNVILRHVNFKTGNVLKYKHI